MNKTFMMNGTDFTDAVTDRGLRIEYRKILGMNGGVMLDGSTVEDIIVWKRTVTVTFLPMTESTLTLLVGAMRNADPTIQVYDPHAQALVTLHVMFEEPSAHFIMNNVEGNDLWIVDPIVMVEK